MGIPNLNKLMTDRGSQFIYKMHLKELNGKSICVDTSIYLYKFIGQGKLVENFYNMLALFRYYNIHAIFVFDGKPPDEKSELLKKRRIDKKEAETKYKELQQEIIKDNVSQELKNEYNIEMEKLRKQFIRIKNFHIQDVKSLILNFGQTYIDAQGEADTLCAYLVKNDIVWATMSDDMDMFAYNSKRVLRYLSLMNHNILYYDFENILHSLNMNIDEFRYMIASCGTDYNIQQNKNIQTVYNNILKIKKINNNESDILDLYCNKLNLNKDEMNNVISLFLLDNTMNYQQVIGEYNHLQLMSFLGNHGFVFIT